MKKILFLCSFFLLLSSLSAELEISSFSPTPISFYPNEIKTIFLEIKNTSQSDTFFISLESQNKFLFSYPTTSKTYSETFYLPENSSTKKLIIIQNLSYQDELVYLNILYGTDYNTARIFPLPIQIKQSPLKISFLDNSNQETRIFNLFLTNDSNFPITDIYITPTPPKDLILTSLPLFLPSLSPVSSLTTLPFSFTPLKKSQGQKEILFTINYTDTEGQHKLLFTQTVDSSNRQFFLLFLALLVIVLAIATLFVQKKKK